MSNEPKIFEEWTEVDCNQCELYFLNQCDGVKNNSKKKCTGFLATRHVIIPEQIKQLQDSIKRLRYSYFTLGIILVIHILLELLP